jgi:hypothetical protein
MDEPTFAKRLEADIAKFAKEAGRECGSCTLCCKLIAVNEGELNKPAGVWCPHCKIGNGCTIYATRPQACRTWTCMWLVRDDVDEYWYPAKCKMVLWWVPLARETPPPNNLEVHVDPGYPNRWREEPWFSDIRKASRNGLESGEFLTFVSIGKQRLLVFPNKAVPAKGQLGLINQIGPDEWGMISGTEEQMKATQDFMGRVMEWRKHATPRERLQVLLEMEAYEKQRGNHETAAKLRGFAQELAVRELR